MSNKQAIYPDALAQAYLDSVGSKYRTLEGADMSHTPFYVDGHTVKALGQIYCIADNPEAAVDIAEAVNNHDRLTAEVGRLRDVLHSIHLRAELAEADGVHMRSALGNIKDDAAKALNPEEVK